MEMSTIGQVAVQIAMEKNDGRLKSLIEKADSLGYKVMTGQVGSMQMEKVIASIETGARRQGLISNVYREEHSLYHAIIEALEGICRGQLNLGNALRTVGLRFSVVSGPKDVEKKEKGDWLAVVLYGTIGAPIPGFEHEAIGMGINHI